MRGPLRRYVHGAAPMALFCSPFILSMVKLAPPLVPFTPETRAVSYPRVRARLTCMVMSLLLQMRHPPCPYNPNVLSYNYRGYN